MLDIRFPIRSRRASIVTTVVVTALTALTASLLLWVPSSGTASADASSRARPAATSPKAAAPVAARASARRLAARGFPTARTTGVPPGWSPKRTVQGDLTIDTPGATVDNVRIINGDLLIAAPNVKVSRVELIGGVINNDVGGSCNSGLKVRATTIRRAPGQTTEGDYPALGPGGYTARRVEIVGLPEGFRVGGAGACGPVKIIRSRAKIVAPDDCSGDDWHGDGLQGYDGGVLTLRDSVLLLVDRPDCGGTAPFFYPSDQGNTSVDIDGLIVAGGGFPFRLGTPGTVRNLKIVQGSWAFGPISVECGALAAWQADVVTLKGSKPVTVRRQSCNTEDGS